MQFVDERIKSLGIKLYQQRPEEDYAIAMWWDRVYQDGTISEFATEACKSLSVFMSMFKNPNLMLYTTHGGNIEMAGWCEPIATSQRAAFFSSWCDPDFRGSKRQAMVMSVIYETIFQFKEVLIGITKHKDLLDLHRKMGYTVEMYVPYLFDDNNAYVAFMTKDAFYEGQLFKTARKLFLKQGD